MRIENYSAVELFTQLTGNNLGKDLGKDLGKEVPVRCRALYALLVENPDYTQAAIAEHLGLSTETVRLQMKILIDSGLVRRVGGRKMGHWEVVQ